MKKYIMVAVVAFLGACSDDKPQEKVEIAQPKPPIVIEQPKAEKEKPKRKYAKGGLMEKLAESNETPESLLNY